jgi:carbon storage regulator
MLVLSRKTSQQIMIGRDIVVTVVKIDRNHVRIGIQAPSGVRILRQELIEEPSSSSPSVPIKRRVPVEE